MSVNLLELTTNWAEITQRNLDMLGLGRDLTIDRLLGGSVDMREPRRTELALEILNCQVDLRTATLETVKQTLLKAYHEADRQLDSEAR